MINGSQTRKSMRATWPAAIRPTVRRKTLLAMRAGVVHAWRNAWGEPRIEFWGQTKVIFSRAQQFAYSYKKNFVAHFKGDDKFLNGNVINKCFLESRE